MGSQFYAISRGFNSIFTFRHFFGQTRIHKRKLRSYLGQARNYDTFQNIKILKKSGFQKFVSTWMQITTNASKFPCSNRVTYK